MKKYYGKWTRFLIRWGIAVLGIAWVLNQTSFHDHVLDGRIGADGRPIKVRIEDGSPSDSPRFWVYYDGRRQYPIERDQVWTPPGERTSVQVYGPDGRPIKAKVLEVLPPPDARPDQPPLALLIADPATHQPRKISPSQVIGGYTIHVPYPRVDIGLIQLVRQANGWFLLISLLLLPISYLITSRRWHLLLEALDIHIGQARTFVLNMVGAFYNSFMPGSTGGDLIKAYYAARHTTHRHRAVMSVIIDRILGLVALILLGGVMAGLQYRNPTCRKVAIASGGLIALMAAGLFIFYHRGLRRKTGLSWLLARMPMQRHVHKVVEALEMYGQKPGVAITAIVMTFPVHITTIVSATFAGKAFGLPLGAMYYWVIVPVILLVGAIPISPQGVGVMEPLAVELTAAQGVTVSQAFALVMAIRFVQIFWNLAASAFVLRGGYHAPTEQEAEELETDDEEPAPVSAVPLLLRS